MAVHRAWNLLGFDGGATESDDVLTAEVRPLIAPELP